MARKIISWRCQYLKCGFDKNWEYADELKNDSKMICMNCGIGTEPKKPLKTSGSWLPCIELTGLDLRLPNGIPAQGWVDGKGDGPFSKENYINRHNVDPERFFYFSHPELKRPQDLQPVPIPDQTQAPTSPPDIPPLSPAEKKILDANARLDAMKAQGKIVEVAYISKLRFLEQLREMRKRDLITDDDVTSRIGAALK